MNQIIAVLRPVQAGGSVANVVRHRRSPRRKNGDIGAPLTLQLELRAFQALPDLVVRDVDFAVVGWLPCILQRGDLRVAIVLERLWRRGVMPVTIDDHESPN